MTSVIAFLVIVMTAEMNFMTSGPKRGFTLLLFFLFFFINLGWIAFLSFSLHHVSKHIKQIQESRGIEKQIKPGLSAFLFFVYFTGIAYIQTHINRTLDAVQPGSSGGAERNAMQWSQPRRREKRWEPRSSRRRSSVIINQKTAPLLTNRPVQSCRCWTDCQDQSFLADYGFIITSLCTFWRCDAGWSFWRCGFEVEYCISRLGMIQ